MRIYLFILIAVSFLYCNKKDKLENNIAKIETNFTIERFDKILSNTKQNGLQNLKKTYPFLFSKSEPDSVWIHKINDTLQKQLLFEVNKNFLDLKETKQQLSSLFQHLKYYNSTFTLPRVVTITNDVDYRNKNIVNDSLVIIALDNYFGEDHFFYQGIPKYLAYNMQKNRIVVDVAESYAKKYAAQTHRKSFLDEMIYFGKLLYFKDVMLPNTKDEIKIGYTSTQMQWAEANQSAIWSYFVERELLFSTDTKLVNRFISDAPFSKFYLELDQSSPGRIGQYIGWQIVKAYANKTNENILQILNKEPEEIFRISKFKPRK